ncbi:MAG: ATP-binding protein [Bacteroides sp.]|nr:ATP-binding protein [Bacteroides sp.]MDE5822197.1 ATP-binding protein [Paramuribaculum sp.]MDE5835837.1 ATP-binding protein [Paramuribaculum sp.]
MRLISRPHYLNQLSGVMNTPDIKIVTGIRRSGKSKLLNAFADYIHKIDSTANVIEIDLTKLRFEKLKEYHALNEYVEEQYKDGVNNYLMIDEVQLCEGFELAINSLHSEEKYDIYLTGSNAFLLSSDLATLFTGRHIEIHVFPFSFKEYCTYFEIADSNMQEAFTDYIQTGGLSGAYPYSRTEDREKYIRDVYETILIRDLVEKYKLGNPTMMKRVSHYLMDNISNISSSRNISNALTNDGTLTNHMTVGNYINYLCNAFVFYEAKRYDVKGKTYLQSLSKYYLADTGIRFAELGKRNMDWGRMLENIVFIELLRRGYEVYVGKLYQKEIDFVAMKGGEKIYIQVSDDISAETTFKREVEPLLKIRDAYPKLLLARTRNEETDYEGIRIVDIPQWLLMEQ